MKEYLNKGLFVGLILSFLLNIALFSTPRKCDTQTYIFCFAMLEWLCIVICSFFSILEKDFK